MKDTPIQILDHIYYRDEASSQTNKFRIASNDSQRMLDKNFSICFSSSNTKYLFIALNEKTDTKEIIQRNISSRVIYLSNQKKSVYTFLWRRWGKMHNKNTWKNL